MKLANEDMKESESKTVRMLDLQFFFWDVTGCRWCQPKSRLQEAASVKALQDQKNNLGESETCPHGLKLEYSKYHSKKIIGTSGSLVAYGSFIFVFLFWILEGLNSSIRSTSGFKNTYRRRPESRAWSSSLPS